jgi:hypothetical protein
MVRILGREQRHAAAVEARTVEVHEVRVAACFTADTREVDGAAAAVHVQQLRHVPRAARHLPLQCAGAQVVQVEVPPVVALRPPQHLVRRRQHPPVLAAHVHPPRLELRRHRLREHRADRARRRVGHAQRHVAGITGDGDERDVRAVGVPLHVQQPVADGDVVVDRRALRVRRHLQPHHARGLDLDDHAVHAERHGVRRQRVAPLLQLRRAHVRRDQVHVADAAGILLERLDPPRVRRPHQQRHRAPRPARVVRGVAEVLHAVRRERAVLARLQVAHPQVVVADVRRPPAVGRGH